MKWEILLLLLCLQLPSFAAWYNNGWAYRAEVRVLHSKVDADLSNYPVYLNLVDFGSGHGIWSHVLSTGADLRITSSDGTTEIPIEVVVIDTTAKTGEVHFKATSLANSSNSSFYLYYGNGDASAYASSATYGRNNVWSSYTAVYHMQQDPASANITDSTGGGRDYSRTGTFTGDSVTGQMSKAVDLDAGDKLQYTGSVANNTTGTLSMWCKLQTGSAARQNLFTLGTDSAGTSYRFIRYDGGIYMQNGSGGQNVNTTAPSENTWTYMVGRYNQASAPNLYINKNTTVVSGTKVLGVAVTADIYHGGGEFDIASTIDEARYSTSVLTDTWLSTEYNNQSSSSTFYTLGAEEAKPVAASNAIMFGTWF